MAKNIRGDVGRIRKIVVYTKNPHHIRKYPSYTTGEAHNTMAVRVKALQETGLEQPCARDFLSYAASGLTSGMTWIKRKS